MDDLSLEGSLKMGVQSQKISHGLNSITPENMHQEIQESQRASRDFGIIIIIIIIIIVFWLL